MACNCFSLSAVGPPPRFPPAPPTHAKKAEEKCLPHCTHRACLDCRPNRHLRGPSGCNESGQGPHFRGVLEIGPRNFPVIIGEGPQRSESGRERGHRSGNKTTRNQKNKQPKEKKGGKTNKSRGKNYRRHPDSNQGPLDLQSNALPLSYTSMAAIARPTPTESARALSNIDLYPPARRPHPQSNPKSVHHAPTRRVLLFFQFSSNLTMICWNPQGSLMGRF